MASLFRSAVIFGLAVGFGTPVSAQSERCSRDVLTLDGIPVAARFCVPTDARAPSVTVTETFSARGNSVEKTVALTLVTGARISRTIDSIDLEPLGLTHSLHVTLAFHGGLVTLEHALALPGAIPLK
jgi:hypothetical protein